MPKEQRWFEVDGDRIAIYNAPFKDASTSVSLVQKSDKRYYANQFDLRHVWGNSFRAGRHPLRDTVAEPW